MPTTRKRPGGSGTDPPGVTAAEQSALDALQQVLDEERIGIAAERLQMKRQLNALQVRIGELEAEIAGTSARLRELEAQLQARSR